MHAFVFYVAAAIGAVLAALIAVPGLVIERWLFFAEAKHAVTLYYGDKIKGTPYLIRD